MHGELAAKAAPVGSLGGRWRAWRNRVLADPGFQRWAARFPLTRPIARKRSSELFDLCAGFVYSQVLLACVRLGVFELLADGSRDVNWLGMRLRLEPRAARRLLDAAVALRLLERVGAGDREYGLAQLGASLRGNPGALAMIEHHELLYADLADPVALLRGETDGSRLGAYWPYAAGDAAALSSREVSGYTRLMSASQSLVAQDILDAWDFGQHRHLLDVGGGDGTFVRAVASVVPGLQFTLFDLPAVIEIARTNVTAAGLGGRVACKGGSFLLDPLPRGSDAATLVRVLHDHDDQSVSSLLRAVHGALEPGGTLVVAEPMADTRGALAMGHAYFGFYLAAMGSGRPRTVAELRGMLEEAGFSGVVERPTARPLLVRVLVARKLVD